MLVLIGLIGLGLNVRPGALLFVGYVAAVAGYWLMAELKFGPTYGRKASTRAQWLRAGAWVLAILAGSIAIGWIFWPWAYQHPLVAPFKATIELGHFGWAGTVLFDGVSYPGRSLPADYVARWFWLTLPPVIMVGLAASVLLLRVPERRDPALTLWGAIAFPVLFVVGTRATLYDGVRHLLFVFPPLVILAAAGWIAAWRSARPLLQAAIAAAAAAGLIEPLAFQVRNHPNQTVYIQPLAGGPAGAYARYDLDYWGNCLLEGLSYVNARDRGDRIVVSGWPLLVLEADVSRFPRLVLADRGDPRVTTFVTLARGTREQLLALAANPGVDHRVTSADGAILCTVSSSDARSPARTSRP
jgi:hypothetical protein